MAVFQMLVISGCIFVTLYISCTVLVGKGRFGSLLRGAATNLEQEKTNNFDVSGDRSGRRLRHVNVVKKLEEWKAGAEERKLEKVAEDFLKKRAKAAKKSTSGDSEKYREVRLKIWTGKRKLDESDTDEDDEADSDDDENICYSGRKCGSSGGGSTESNFEEENDVAGRRGFELEEATRSKAVHAEAEVSVDSELGIRKKTMFQALRPGISDLEAGAASGIEAVQAGGTGPIEPESGNHEEQVGQATSGTGLEESKGSDGGAIAAKPNDAVEPKLEYHDIVIEDANISDMKKPLNFEEFNFAAEVEVILPLIRIYFVSVGLVAAV
ncbi:LOW QUALITY PROTEIN: replication stress response regulator SDE2-like [Telopea speciosissima]|uniref:LOW QUALITY PROTEIN: replication stress response regulator SDE2-like n=1 Tax=Telopea speciosissima TaxID=54955 RepID=UPI001CC51163|nr:LOW QUALITY PROTEIN: replication stress response regulator SDE2-like [Telopea speciosissima]